VLVRLARLAKKHSYSPYSPFRVGAALLARSGKVYNGLQYRKQFLWADCLRRTNGDFQGRVRRSAGVFLPSLSPPMKTAAPRPAAACRQVLLDLAGDIEVIMVGRKGPATVTTMSELLPLPFGATHLVKE